jgi:hypothetical protein
MASSFFRFFLLPVLAALLLSSCVSDYYPSSDGNIFLRQRRPPKYGHGGTDSPPADAGAADASRARQPRGDVEGEVGAARRGGTEYLPETPDTPGERTEETTPERPPPDRTADETSKPSDSGTTPRTGNAGTSKPAATEDSNLQFGIPVPGKEGLVYSPYYSGGYVDVKGMPPGSKARCPYTKKIFRVP